MCLVALVAVPSLPTAAHAGFGGPNGEIAFSSNRGGTDRDIWIMNPDGSDPRNITADMSSNEDWPIWSPDGTKIAFQTDLGGNFEIYTMRADGSSRQNITNAAGNDQAPTWSTTGWIGYTRDPGSGNYDIWKKRADGTGVPVQLTNSTSQDTHPSWDTGGGGTMAFISNRPAAEGGNGIFQLFIMDSDGNNETPQLSGEEEFNPHWDPTATKLIFDRFTPGPDSDVVSRNYNGTGCCVNWTPEADPYFDIEPAWSPDGTQFSWTSTRSGNTDIWVAPFGGFRQNVAPDAGADDRHSDWGVRAPKIVIVKNSVPDDPQDFSFTASGGLTPASFQLDDDPSGALSNTRTFEYVSPGSYTVTETDPAPGFDLTALSCDDSNSTVDVGTRTASISLQANETVTCTFTNTKRGTIKIKKDAVPDDAADFSFTDNIPGCTIGPLDDDGDGTLANETTCTVAPGSYAVAESDPTPGFDLTALSCDDSNSTGNVGTRTASISLQSGETVTCTFTNRKRGQIVVEKDAIPNDAQDFSFTAGGGLSPSSFQLDDDADGTLSNTRTFDHLTPGTGYTLSESVPSGWDQISATCNDGSPVTNIDVAPGETVTCTFTNGKRGQIVVEKDAIPNDAQNFSFTAGGGLSPSTFQLDDDSDGTLSNTRSFDVAAGSGYSVAETVPAGWDQDSATCDDASPVSNIDVTAGETVTCTFTNRKQTRIVVRKDAIPDDAQDFSFTAGGGLSPSSFQLDDDSDGTLANTRTFDVAPGNGYSVSETVPAGWFLADVRCDDGSHVQSIAIDAGETVTCVFKNARGYARPSSASPVRVALVPAYDECTSGNRTHGPPLAHPACSPPAQSSSSLTVGTPDANGPAANSVGTARMAAVVGDPSTSADEADVVVTTSLTDVRNESDLSDYTGELQLSAAVQITDRFNDNSINLTAPGTSEGTLAFTVPCTPTSGSAGANCALTTTVDAVIAGAVLETKRSIWALDALRVFDGGADGDAETTGDNTLFARQGVFIP